MSSGTGGGGRGDFVRRDKTDRKMISSRSFYGEYHGHKVRHLQTLLKTLREGSDRLIWTAGDSSLDNKYWFHNAAPAPGLYQDVLQPPQSKLDVTYWLNHLLSRDDANPGRRGGSNEDNDNNQRERYRTAAINTAVEATTLNERTFRLRPQDAFLRDNLEPDDILVVSVGGNDVALSPLPCTIASIVGVVCCVPSCCIERARAFGTVPLDDCCCGCGPSLCSCACACPPCLGYLRHLFGTRMQKYIEALTSKTKPAKVLVCSIYYPDERREPGWAGPALSALRYDSNPAKLQLLIRKGFHEALSAIRVEGTEVVPVPLYHALDGKNTDDYVQRVEPSPAGGRKMAEFILDIIHQPPETTTASGPSVVPSSAPTTSYIPDRS